MQPPSATGSTAILPLAPEAFRSHAPVCLLNESVCVFVDYNSHGTGLPGSNVLQFQRANAKILVRPSGTEPKLKLYLSARSGTMADAEKMNKDILNRLTDEYIK